MTTSKFTFDLGSSGPSDGITFEVWLDNQCLINTNDFTARTITCEFPDAEDQEHTLKLVMQGKTEEHTKIDDQGNIVQDTCIDVTNLTFDDIPLGFNITNQMVYAHDFNGTQAPVQEKFYGIMGCNGEVALIFRTPVYLWMLEHL